MVSDKMMESCQIIDFKKVPSDDQNEEDQGQVTFAPKGINSQAASASYQHIVIEENSDETKIACDVCQYEDDFDDDEIFICNLC